MRTTLDFSPLFRSSIGFDRIVDLLDSASRLQGLDGWPRYDIVKTGDNAYRITMAVAGFSPETITLIHEPNLLVVRGAKPDDDDDGGLYLHRGIAARPFERRFELADYVKVTDAVVADGLLTIDLVRELPEEMKPRRIEIRTSEALSKPDTRQIEAA